jgi:hypothetical protein
MISLKLLPVRFGSFWMRLESSGTKGGLFSSESSASGLRSNGDLTTAFSSEIAELMSVKSKHGAGGEFTPNWAPQVRQPNVFSWDLPFVQMLGKADLPPPPPPPPLAADDDGPLQPAKPAWRTVHKRPERKRKQITAGTPAPPPAPQLASPPVKPETPSWAQWRRA